MAAAGIPDAPRGAIYPALSGFKLRCGARQSMPSLEDVQECPLQ